MEGYAGQQVVGIDLHRRRSVIVRMDDQGHGLETIRISNDVDRLTEVMSRAGVHPEVVLEATYGWYWAADALAAMGAQVHLAHPLGVKAFSYRRVKNDVRDATDLADLLRMGRLPEAWIAPPPTRELRELVRHRAKLVALRSGCKCEVHAVLAKCGVQVLMSDLFGDERDRRCWSALRAPAPYLARVGSLRRLIDELDEEIDLFDRLVRGRLVKDRGYAAVQRIPGIGPVLGAVFVAEIGDVHRFPGPQLCSWAGLTLKHHESDTHADGLVSRVLGRSRPPRTASRRSACSGRCRSGSYRDRVGRCCRRLRSVADPGPVGKLLSGQVEVDESLHRRRGARAGRRAGQGREGARRRRGRSQVCPRVSGGAGCASVPDGSAKTLHAFITDTVAAGSTVDRRRNGPAAAASRRRAT